MWLIWLILAILLVVIVAGGFGRHRYTQAKATRGQVNPHQGHHDKAHQNHRGRGKGH